MPPAAALLRAAHRLHDKWPHRGYGAPVRRCQHAPTFFCLCTALRTQSLPPDLVQCDSMACPGELVAKRMAHAGAVAEWRKLLGPTDSDVARREAPGTIRALFGTDKTQNACHGSDAPQTAKQECDLFFRQKVCNTIPNPALCSTFYDPAWQWCEAETFAVLDARLAGVGATRAAACAL